MASTTGVRVFTAGVFDILHVGHINLLRGAKALGDTLIVGVLTDEGAERYKPRPLMPFEQRFELISQLRMVDEVLQLDDSDATELLKQVCPDILVHGSDILAKPDWEIGQSWMKQQGRQYVVLPYTDGVSSTRLKNAVRARTA